MATIDEKDRDTLAKLLYEDGGAYPWGTISDAARKPWRDIADTILAAGWRPPEAPVKREWPVSEDAVKVWRDAFYDELGNEATALSEVAPHLLRARVEGMTKDELAVLGERIGISVSLHGFRAALLALGDL